MNSTRAAALIWLSGATVYLVCEGIAAAGTPGYDYVVNYISDLGRSTVILWELMTGIAILRSQSVTGRTDPPG